MIDRICLKIEQNKHSKLLKILIFCVSFLFVCTFISIKAHASGVNLPYVPKTTNYYLTEEEYNLIRSVILETDSSIDIDNENVIIFKSTEGGWFDYGTNTDLLLYNVYVLDGVSCYSSWSNNSDFSNFVLFDSNYYLDVTLNDCYYFGLTRRDIGNKGDGKWSVNNYRTNNIHKQFYGDSTSIHIQNSKFDFTYLANYPIYCNVDFYTSDPLQTVDVFLGVGSEPSEVTGSAIAPTFGAGAGVGGSDFLVSGADFGASVSQATKPNAPTITNYTWNTYNAPTVDTSTLETLLQSLIDIVKYNTTYIVGGITGLIENLLTNLQNMFGYIGGLIEYSLRVLITNIQNAIQNLYENFKSLVEPIFQLLEIVKEKVEYITEPFDKEEFFHQVDGNHLITACIHIKDYGDQMKSIFTNAQERNTFHLNITYPKPDGTSFQTMISFDWLYPLRHLYMPYLWVFTILYLFFSACRLLGNVTGGKS